MAVTVQVLHEIRPMREAICAAEAATGPAAKGVQLRIQEDIGQAAQRYFSPYLASVLALPGHIVLGLPVT